MRQPQFTTKFRKDVKRAKRRGKSRQKLQALIETILLEGDAPTSCRPRNLSGDWSGFRECHIEPDWLLIYVAEDDIVTFYRTGTHADLFE